MRAALVLLILALSASMTFGQSEWPAGFPRSKTSNERLELAPDLANRELPINHAKLVWFVSARQLVRQGAPDMDKVALAPMLDQDLASATMFTKPGKYEILFDLQRTVMVDRVCIVTDNVGFPVSVRVSDADLSRNEGSAWREIGSSTTKVPITRFDFALDRIRFIHVTIDASKASPQSPLGVFEFAVFGQEDLRDYVLNLTPEKDVKSRETFVDSTTGGLYPPWLLQNDLANLDAGSNVVFVSSKAEDPHVSHMIDDDPETRWTADRGEKETLVLIDLGQQRKVRRVSVMHTSRSGKILAYVLQSVPTKTAKTAQVAWLEPAIAASDAPLLTLAANAAPEGLEQPNLSPEWLNGQAPFGTIDTEKSNFSQIRGEPQTGRYVLLRYQNTSPGSGTPLVINGVNIFGEYGIGEFVLMPRNLPIIAAGGFTVAPPNATTLGLSISDQLHPPPVEPPKPPPVTP